MNEVTANAYILYAFMAFQSLLLLALLGAVLRLMFLVGRIQGEITGLREEIHRLWEAIAALTVRVERLEEQVAHLREQVAEKPRAAAGAARADRPGDASPPRRADGRRHTDSYRGPPPEPVADPAGD